jgi:gamma-glutamyltranspeptidase/glutathione hydrolase
MVQLMVEAERRAFADRAAYTGDPDFWKVPVKTLTSNAYLAQRMANCDSTKPTPSSMIKEGQIPEHDETTHISIMDAEGNMVSITTTLNGWYGSRTVVGGAGFFLNNEMDDFSVKPGVPNMVGAVGGEANAIQPRKRMLSSMAPTLVLKNNQPFMVCGTPGGTTIPTSVFQTLVDVLIFNMSAEQAIAAPKFHHQWLPDVIFVEPNFPKNTIQQLEAMGYKIQQRGPIGRTEIIKVLTYGNKETAAGIRGDDAVAGY